MDVGHIYLIMNTNFEYKIGMTKKSVSDRVKQLQTGNSGELKIISYYEVKNYAEQNNSFIIEFITFMEFFNNKNFYEQRKHI